MMLMMRTERAHLRKASASVNDDLCWHWVPLLLSYFKRTGANRTACIADLKGLVLDWVERPCQMKDAPVSAEMSA
jgi:hypothetical protein